MTDPSDFVMPFGKHKGKTLDDVPLSYLEWLRDLDDLQEPLLSAVLEYCEQDWFQGELEREEDGWERDRQLWGPPP